MFLSKKKKIQKYLDGKPAGERMPFDELLSDWLSGKLTEEIGSLGVKRVEIHVDWLADYRCIGVQGVCHGNYLDLQIGQQEFSVGYDPAEPDEHRYYPLESREQVYTVLKELLSK